MFLFIQTWENDTLVVYCCWNGENDDQHEIFFIKKTCLRSSHPSTESTGNSLNSQILGQIYDDLCICSEAWSLSEKPVSGLPHPAV